MLGSRPVGCALCLPEGRTLELKFFFRSISRWHVASVHSESRAFSFGREVIMRSATIPQKQVTRLSIHLYPLCHPLSVKPYHSFVHAQILSGSSLNSSWNSSLSLYVHGQTVKPPSLGRLGRILMSPCMHLKPGFFGSWS